MPNLQRKRPSCNFACYSMQIYGPGDAKGGPWPNAPPKNAPVHVPPLDGKVGYILQLLLTSSHKFPSIFLRQNSTKTIHKVWFSAFKRMVAQMSQLQAFGFQRKLFTAGLPLVTYNNNLYIVVESFRLGRKQNDLCCLRVKRPPVHHIWWRLYTDPFIAERQTRKAEISVFSLHNVPFFEL